MKKIVIGLMLGIISVLSFGKIESELTKDEYGKYSGSASLQLVARGRIVEKPKYEILVIETEGKDSAIELLHKDVKNGKKQVLTQQFKATIFEKDENGNLIVSKNNNKISSELVNENGKEDIMVQNLQGENIGKIEYTLSGKEVKNEAYIGTITSTLVVDENNNGNFIEKSTNIKINI